MMIRTAFTPAPRTRAAAAAAAAEATVSIEAFRNRRTRLFPTFRANTAD
ncbi:hypothetical protein [Microbacterium sp. 18062]|nr:hypothetical protein [Microbacterium sp. 18062]